MRRGVIDRRTTETQIQLAIGLEGRGRYAVRTGIRFLDHMLELFARHGAFDLKVQATGDLDVDQHHTVEDVGIVLGAATLEAALGDQAHLDGYRTQVRASKAKFYAFCDRLGLGYWRSDANFVLVRVGARATAVVDALRERRIFVRDRSGEPGCAGCIRITAGIVAHTDACLSALEDILCAVA